MQAGAQQGARPGVDGKANGLPPVPPPPPLAFRESPALGLGRSVRALHAWSVTRGVKWRSCLETYQSLLRMPRTWVGRTNCYSHYIRRTVGGLFV